MYFDRIETQIGMNPLGGNPCQLLDFAKLTLEPGGEYEGNTRDAEALLVVLSGQANVNACGV